MKKIVLVASAALLLITSCAEHSKEYKDLQAKVDSLMQVNDNYETDLEETDSLVAAVINNFQDINSVEGMIDLRPGQELSSSQKDRIRDNVNIINDKLRASSEALEALMKMLESSGSDNKRLRQTIKALQKDLEGQKLRILALTEELKRKDLAINALDSIVTGLNNDVERLNEATSRQAATLAAQEHELNMVRYCIGTKGDLKDYRLLQGGKIVTDNADLSYFTKADQRKLTQIPVYARKAQLLSPHPTASYEFIADANRNLTLNIKDHKLFWSASKLLIIQVD